MAQTQTQSPLPFFPDDAGAAGRAAQAGMLRHSPPPEPGAWDEWRHADGRMRERWRDFVEQMPPLPPGSSLADELDRRVVQVARQIRHDGITHNV
ncbi:MAG: circularly permuted type 2 ATP-grasp protein, partial [Rubrivivax sp.]